MGVSDNFPLVPDFSIVRTNLGGTRRIDCENAKAVFALDAPPRRVFSLEMTARLTSEWEAFRAWRESFLTDYFTYHDPTLDRKFSVHFNSEPKYGETSTGRHNIAVELIEAVGKPLQVYPSFSAGHPYGTASRFTLISTGVYGFVYAGYGYQISGSGISSVTLDGVAVGSAALNESVPLGLHRVRVSASVVAYLDFLV